MKTLASKQPELQHRLNRVKFCTFQHPIKPFLQVQEILLFKNKSTKKKVKVSQLMDEKKKPNSRGKRDLIYQAL